MGQGTESCGGYEVDYDPWEEGLETGTWTQRDHSPINVKDMSTRHLFGAKRVAEKAALNATFSSDTEKWRAWVELFEDEIRSRPYHPSKPKTGVPQRGTQVAMICHCGQEYLARAADIKRGWGLSCTKRCAAIRREFNKPAAKPKR